MIFSSLFFIFLFLPANLLAYYIPKKINTKNTVMLIFSLIFYAWGEPKYVFLLLFLSFTSWFFALQTEKFKSENQKKAKLMTALGCALAILVLGIFKYAGFILTNIQSLTGFPENIPEIALPIGISFYTFQLMTYIIDVYRGDAPAQKRYDRLLLYASLFHQCIAGPIVRYSDISNEITDRKPDFDDFNRGVMRFSTGLAKKVLLANNCGSLADALLAGDTTVLADSVSLLSSRSALSVWVGMIFYMLQLYLDFSAYSDMAIGMGLMTGFHYRENFDYPYTSHSVTEFWRRWHISLSSFFRDYVYIPLGGNRKGKTRQSFNLFVVWTLTGLWHGASWNYVLWGLYFFVFLVLEKTFLSEKLKKAPRALSCIYTLAIVYFSWVLFKFEDMTLLKTALKGMFGLNGNPLATHESFVYTASNLPFLILAAVSTTPMVKYLQKVIDRLSVRYSAVNTVYCVFRTVIPAVLVILSAVCLVGDSYNPFLYFRF